MHVDLLILHGRLVTPPASAHPLSGDAMDRLWTLNDGAIAIHHGIIVEIGPTASLTRRLTATRMFQANGRVITPGFVDAHTHLVFAGDRAHEFERRIKGASYQDIARHGGGILSTVKAVRAAPERTLFTLASSRLNAALAHGTTTMEIKSGYGLSLDAELKMLRVIHQLQRTHAVEVISTFLGAHALPSNYLRRRSAYVALVSDHMIPKIAQSGLAEFFDVFCDEGAFTVAETRRMCTAALHTGLAIKLHAQEFSSNGGAQLAASLGAVSADHLLRLNRRDMIALRDAGTVAVLLPGTPFGLGLDGYAPAREMIRAGLPVGLGTDCNPGTSYCESMPMMMTLACTQMRMTPAEALTAATLNAAWAIGRGMTLGCLAAGRQADCVVWNVPDERHLAYHYGVPLTHTVVKRGRVAWTRS